MGTQLPPPTERAQQPPIFGRCLLWPNGRPYQQLVSWCILLWIRKHDTESSNGNDNRKSWCFSIKINQLESIHVKWIGEYARITDCTALIYTMFKQWTSLNKNAVRPWQQSCSSAGPAGLVAELTGSWCPPCPAASVWSPSSAVCRGRTSSADCPSANQKFPCVSIMLTSVTCSSTTCAPTTILTAVFQWTLYLAYRCQKISFFY